MPKKIREGQAKKNLEERNYASHVNNLGFRDLSVRRGRHTTLKFSLKMRKRGRRKKHKLHPKKRGMKKEKEKPTPEIEKNAVLSGVPIFHTLRIKGSI